MIGALVPLAAAVLAGSSVRGVAITLATLVSLLALGALGAALGRADMLRGALRVGLGGAAALAVTYGVGLLLGTTVL